MYICIQVGHPYIEHSFWVCTDMIKEIPATVFPFGLLHGNTVPLSNDFGEVRTRAPSPHSTREKKAD